MNIRSNFIWKCLLTMALLVPSLLYAQVTKECFKARIQTPAKEVMNVHLTSSDTISLKHLGPIYALSIDATIEQPREASFVRIVLEDTEGHNYLVAESDWFRNDTTIVQLSEYCEETAQLNGVTPLRLKCYLTNASLQLTGLHISSEMPKRGMMTRAEQESVKTAQVQDVVDRINAYNVRHGRLWRAGVTSMVLESFDNQSTNETEDSYMANFKYYVDGIFEIGERPTRSSYENDFVDTFDWRNRHGRNWMLDSIGDQYDTTENCKFFAATGAAEAVANLYFNKLLDINLSEQYIMNYSLDYNPCYHLYQAGDIDEESMPYNGGYDATAPVPEGNEHLQYSGYTRIVGRNQHGQILSKKEFTDSIKTCLIKYGPMIWGFSCNNMYQYEGVNFNNHYMTLVGFGKVDVGEYYNYIVNNEEDGTWAPAPNVPFKQEYWIFKDSFGHRKDSLFKHGGYRYLIIYNYENMSPVADYLHTPVLWRGHTDSEIVCEDRDGDGFFYWGIGDSVPNSLPDWAPLIKDGDDSDADKGQMFDNGKLEDLSYYNNDTATITTSYSDDNFYSIYNFKFFRGHYTFINGGSLTINGDLHCRPQSTLTISDGGILRINGGKLYNPTIIAEPGSAIIIENGGQIIYDNKPCDFNVPIGCTLQMTNGSIIP